MVKEQVITEHAVIYFRVIPLYTVMENKIQYLHFFSLQKTSALSAR